MKEWKDDWLNKLESVASDLKERDGIVKSINSFDKQIEDNKYKLKRMEMLEPISDYETVSIKDLNGNIVLSLFITEYHNIMFITLKHELNNIILNYKSIVKISDSEMITIKKQIVSYLTNNIFNKTNFENFLLKFNLKTV